MVGELLLSSVNGLCGEVMGFRQWGSLIVKAYRGVEEQAFMWHDVGDEGKR